MEVSVETLHMTNVTKEVKCSGQDDRWVGGKEERGTETGEETPSEKIS